MFSGRLCRPFKLLTAYCILHTAYCILLTAYCLLLTTVWPLLKTAFLTLGPICCSSSEAHPSVSVATRLYASGRRPCGLRSWATHRYHRAMTVAATLEVA